ncbi:MAG: hypothetical protein AB7P04_00680 [Bacteriovoracia bacterium]
MQKWWVKTADGKDLGPLTLEEIQSRLVGGEISKDDLLSQVPGQGGVRVQEFLLSTINPTPSSAPLVEPEFKKLSTDSLVQLFDTLQKASHAERHSRHLPPASTLKDPETVEPKVRVFNLKIATYTAIVVFAGFSVWGLGKMLSMMRGSPTSPTAQVEADHGTTETSKPAVIHTPPPSKPKVVGFPHASPPSAFRPLPTARPPRINRPSGATTPSPVEKPADNPLDPFPESHDDPPPEEPMHNDAPSDTGGEDLQPMDTDPIGTPPGATDSPHLGTPPVPPPNPNVDDQQPID